MADINYRIRLRRQSQFHKPGSVTATIALLRAVNVGGTGKLPMAELKAMAMGLGFENAQTYIASGNLLFDTDLTQAAVKRLLEDKLSDYAGKPVGVAVRSGAEMARIVTDNPFAEEPGNRVVVIFLDKPPPQSALFDARHQADERIAAGKREFYVYYPGGMGSSRLVIPAARTGTARNMNTVAKLADLASS